MPRVVALGLDGAEWQLIEPMLESGALPNLRGLRGRGAVSRLRNSAAYRTSLVWPTFLSSRSEAASPASGAIGFDPVEYQTWKLGARRDQVFFADRLDVRALTFDVPYLPLLQAGDGVRVSEWGPANDSCVRASHPAGLLPEIDAVFGEHPAVPIQYKTSWHQPRAIDELADALCEGIRRRAEICRWLVDRFPEHEFFLAVMTEAHSASEAFGHGPDDPTPLASVPTASQARKRVLDVYQALDRAVGHVSATLPPDTVLVVFALHGLSFVSHDLQATVLLPELLYRLAFARPFLRDPDQGAWRLAGHPPIVPDRDKTADDSIRNRMRRRGLAGLRRRMRPSRIGLRRGRASAPHEPDDRGEAVRWPLDNQPACWFRPHWGRMPAFALPSFSDGRVRINLVGRERNGVVEPEDYGAACDEVERQIRACHDARTGSPIAGTISRPRAHDPLDPAGVDADLVVEFEGWVDALNHPLAGCIGPFPSLRTSGHSPRGFALMAGPGLEPGDAGEHDATDLVPTLVRLLGHVPAEGLAGVPIRSVISHA